jgi:hypothetical protein
MLVHEAILLPNVLPINCRLSAVQPDYDDAIRLYVIDTTSGPTGNLL